MSAYVVRDEVINTVANWLFHKASYAGQHELTSYLVKKAGYDGDNTWDATRLGKDLFEMNCQAINDADGHPGAAAMYRTLDYKFIRQMPKSSFTVLKSMEELLYQCTEGGPVQESELYKLVQKATREIRRVIVDNLDSYKAAAPY